MADFGANIIVNLVNVATEADVHPSLLTPVYGIYKPNTIVYDGEGTPDLNPADQEPPAPHEKTTLTPEIGETYLGASILLLCGGTLAR